MRIERDEIGRANEKEMVGRVIRRQPKRWSENKEIKDGCGQSCTQNGKLTFLFALWTRFFINLQRRFYLTKLSFKKIMVCLFCSLSVGGNQITPKFPESLLCIFVF